MWYLTTLSMPKRKIEPHGKVMASATPRHVVMIERLAELFRGKDGRFDRAARLLLDIGGPILGGRHERMGWREPQRDLELDFLVLRRDGRRKDDRDHQDRNCKRPNPRSSPRVARAPTGARLPI